MKIPSSPPGMDESAVQRTGARRLAQLFSDMSRRVELPGGPVVVALSGGADSAAAAWLAIRAGRKCRAVHVNHSLPYSVQMAKAAGAICQHLGIEIAEVVIDTGPDRSEDALRTARYRALVEHSQPDEVVITAHTADDQAETVLHNLLRGTGLDGVAGIPISRGRFHRPLLGVWRSQTRELATLAGLPWEDDPQNDDPRYLRNRIRRRLLPQLEAEYQPRLREGLVRLSELARADLAYLEETASSIPISVSPDGSVEVSSSRLVELSPPIASRVVRRALRLVRGPHAGVGAEVARVLAVAHGKIPRTELAGGVVVKRSGDRLLMIMNG